MFTKRTIKQQRSVDHVDTSADALAVSIGERARVDLSYMAQLTGKSEEDIVQELTGVIFRIPGTEAQYVTADEYLSGNVRQKLREARTAAQSDAAFQPNVTALEAAQPKDLEASDIDVRLGATWIAPEYIQDFMYELLNTPYYQRRAIEVHFSPHTAEWRINGKNVVSRSNVAAYGQEGKMTVKVVIADGKIAAVEIVENHETQVIAAGALEKIPAAIVAANSPDVDSVSGATLTSGRIMNAVALCLEEAAK